MAQEFGLSFVPGDQNDPLKKKIGEGATTPTQQAIRLLSLRLPRVLGGSPIAPAPLLTSQGGAGRPSPESIAQQVLSRVLPTGATSASPSAPNVPTPAQAQMQPPAPSYTDNPRPFSQSPIQRQTPPNLVAQPGGPQPVPRVEPITGTGAPLPNIPTTPNSMPPIPAPTAPAPNVPPVDLSVPQPEVSGMPNKPDLSKPQTEPWIGRPDLTIPQTAQWMPSYVNQLSPEMEDLLNRIRNKYSGGYTKNVEM